MKPPNAGRTGVWGASGSGKSAYVKQVIKPLKRVVVFDPMDEYATLGFDLVSTVPEVQQIMRQKWRDFRIAIVPYPGFEPRTLNLLSSLLLRAQDPYRRTGHGDNLTLVVEEMNLGFPLGGAGKAKRFAEICSRGRHYGIEVYGLSQRIAEVDTRFRGNCLTTIALRQQGKNDVQAAADALGVDKARVQALKNLEYLRSEGGEVTEGKVTFTRNSRRKVA